jgi:hypothetical protein
MIANVRRRAASVAMSPAPAGAADVDVAAMDRA